MIDDWSELWSEADRTDLSLSCSLSCSLLLSPHPHPFSLPATNPDPSLSKHVYNKDWNEEYQRLLERPAVTPMAMKERLSSMNTLVQEFIDCAREIAQVIVKELHQPIAEKSVKPLVEQLGVAGGVKYLEANIFFVSRFHFIKRGYCPKYCCDGDDNGDSDDPNWWRQSRNSLKTIKEFIHLMHLPKKLHPMRFEVSILSFSAKSMVFTTHLLRSSILVVMWWYARVCYRLLVHPL